MFRGHRWPSRSPGAALLFALTFASTAYAEEPPTPPAREAQEAPAAGHAASEAAHADEEHAAAGEEHEGQPGHEAHEAHHPGWRLGLIGTGLASLDLGTESHWSGSGGGGLFIKREVHHHVVLGLVTHVLAVPGEHGLEIPVDLLVEVPFHVSHDFHPYVGLGPTVSVLLFKELDESHTRVSFGAAAVAGAEYWVRNNVALLAELNFNWLYNLSSDDPRHALQPGGSAGVLLAF